MNLLRKRRSATTTGLARELFGMVSPSRPSEPTNHNVTLTPRARCSKTAPCVVIVHLRPCPIRSAKTQKDTPAAKNCVTIFSHPPAKRPTHNFPACACACTFLEGRGTSHLLADPPSRNESLCPPCVVEPGASSTSSSSEASSRWRATKLTTALSPLVHPTEVLKIVLRQPCHRCLRRSSRLPDLANNATSGRPPPARRRRGRHSGRRQRTPF
mmetsp:Transcript_121548/g.389221  ORF Transcript_121548/g.389221 Transcript_121548/m.389221 type:complete len:213 (-) Transcript_121548:72-710(-)